MIRRAGAVLIIAALLFCNACTAITGGKKLPQPPESKYVIGFSPSGMEIDFNSLLYRGMYNAAEKHKIKLLVKNPAGDPKKQAQDIKWFAKQKIDALIVQPTDSEKIGKTIKEVKDKGIPVITIVNPVQSSSVSTHISPDYKEMGEDTAAALKDFLKTRENARMVLITTNRNLKCLEEYYSSFKAQIEKQETLEIIDEISCSTVSMAEGGDALNKIFTKHRKVDVIFAVAEVLLLGGMGNIEQNVKEMIFIAGMGASKKTYVAIKQGSLHVVADILGEDIGKKAIEAGYRLVKGERLPPEITTGHRVITVENVDELAK